MHFRCKDILSGFTVKLFHQLAAKDREKYLGVNSEKCAKLCVESHSFVCRSFSYQ